MMTSRTRYRITGEITGWPWAVSNCYCADAIRLNFSPAGDVARHRDSAPASSADMSRRRKRPLERRERLFYARERFQAAGELSAT